MPGKAGQSVKSIRSKKTIGQVDQSNKSIGKPALIEKSDLTPAASRIARYARIEAMGLDAIMAKMSEQGQSFRLVAEWVGVPTVDLWAWIREDVARERAYNLAVEAKAHTYMEEAHVLADRVVDGDLDPRRADVKIKLSQWSAARTQAYQERKSVEHTIVHKLDQDDLKARLAQLVDVAASRTIEGSCTIVTPDAA